VDRFAFLFGKTPEDTFGERDGLKITLNNLAVNDGGFYILQSDAPLSHTLERM